MAELDRAHSLELKRNHGNTDITREISIVDQEADRYVVQVQDVFCRNEDPRSRCTDVKECFRTSRRSAEMSLKDALAFADKEFAHSVDVEQFIPHQRLSQSPFVLIPVEDNGHE